MAVANLLWRLADRTPAQGRGGGGAAAFNGRALIARLYVQLVKYATALGLGTGRCGLPLPSQRARGESPGRMIVVFPASLSEEQLC
jgi:hypothetical protein